VRRRWKWAIALFVIFAIAATVFAFLPKLLLAPANAIPADVILHSATSSHRSEADDYVAQLYQQKLAKKIVCISRAESCGVYAADDSRRRLLERGIPAEDVLTLYLPRTECVAPSFPHMVEMAKANGWQRAMLIVAPLRSRVTGNIAMKYFQQAGMQLSVAYAPQAAQEITTRWWRDHQTAQNTIEALISTVIDPIYPECR
jgi:uncharacterized SAM-binding protein YcdF (DUF218 family)